MYLLLAFVNGQKAACHAYPGTKRKWGSRPHISGHIMGKLWNKPACNISLWTYKS